MRSFLARMRARFSRKGKTAVLIIDMQTSFVGRLDSVVREKLIEEQIRLLRHCAQNDVPVIVLELRNSRGFGRTVRELDVELHAVANIWRIVKACDDGFSNVELEHRLREIGVSTLVLTGINASYCVLDTAKSALRRGFRIVTADTLIANCGCLMCQTDAEVSSNHRAWHESNATLFFTGSVEPDQILVPRA